MVNSMPLQAEESSLEKGGWLYIESNNLKLFGVFRKVLGPVLQSMPFSQDEKNLGRVRSYPLTNHYKSRSNSTRDEALGMTRTSYIVSLLVVMFLSMHRASANSVSIIYPQGKLAVNGCWFWVKYSPILLPKVRPRGVFHVIRWPLGVI
ncbi:MAG: hypothetical protein GY696_02605 [Gammaproteobacteria bacterium]|nr:hypothetical protein [Gammaproteobacteria bacterium]